MPLDGHSYLVSQGWGGKGTGLRQGAISRPIAIPQKKNLAGLGKDRDEAFPFWDHLFSAASKSIKVCCSSDEEGDNDDKSTSSNEVSLKRTSTGILSTRRPVVGQIADSGTSTPSDESNANTPRLSLMAQAKREAAKRGLYSRFFRGPVLGPAEIAKEEERLATLVKETFAKAESAMQSVTIKEHIEVETTEERVVVDLEVSKSSSKKKRKQKDLDQESVGGDDKVTEKERKRRRKEEKRKQKEEERDAKSSSSSSRKEKKEKKKHKKEKEPHSVTDDSSQRQSSSKASEMQDANYSMSDEENEKEQRRRRKEKRRLKEKKKMEPEADTTVAGEISSGPQSRSLTQCSSKKYRKVKPENRRTPSPDVEQAQDRKKKKKRKRTDDED